MTYLMVCAGLVLLFVGGEALVRGSVSVARKLNISELVIGLTLVGFGTSAPELVTSLRAIGQDAVGISVGNVVGSNIANVLLVLGVTCLIKPIFVKPKALFRGGFFMICVTGILCVLIWFDQFTKVTGGVMVAMLLAYIGLSLWADQRRDSTAQMHADEGESVDADYGVWLGLIIAIVGVVAVVFGARFLVDGGIVIARQFGVSEAVIGLSIVAIGTSLPELATSAVAAFKGKSDVALGNVIGSNIFNVLGILGITALVHPFSVMEEPGKTGELSGAAMAGSGPVSVMSWEDIGALLLSVFLLFLFAFTGKRIARWEGIVLLGAYVLYFGLLFDLIPIPNLIPHV